MKIEIADLQKTDRSASRLLRIYVKQISLYLQLPRKYLSVLLCDDAKIRELNKKFFHRDIVTDVIAFPLDDEKCFGEIIISVERAARVCEKYGNTWADEFKLYVIHGILHILGYDDTTAAKKKVMFKKQDEVFEYIKDR
jgi:rRNA maturation RNase YbeY